MKKLLVLGLLWLGVSTVSAQAPLEVGGFQVNAGLGFSSVVGVPVAVGVDYGAHEDITVGAEAVTIFVSSYRAYALKVNGNYHFNTLLNIPSNFDVYSGINVGYYYASLGYLDYGIQLGGRYFFTDKWALNLELGGGNLASGGKIGVTYKL